MTHDEVQNWLDAYVDAWRSSGTAKLAGIFAETISYSLSPWKSPLHGLAALKTFWQKARSGPDEVFELHSRIIAIEDKTAVVRVEVTYANDTPSQWRDLWILQFDANGLCVAFEEWPFAPGQDDGQTAPA